MILLVHVSSSPWDGWDHCLYRTCTDMSRWMKETTCPGLLRKAATLIASHWVFLRACDTALGAPRINPASANRFVPQDVSRLRGSLYLNPCETIRMQRLWHLDEVDSPHSSTLLLSDQSSSITSVKNFFSKLKCYIRERWCLEF